MHVTGMMIIASHTSMHEPVQHMVEWLPVLGRCCIIQGVVVSGKDRHQAERWCARDNEVDHKGEGVAISPAGGCTMSIQTARTSVP